MQRASIVRTLRRLPLPKSWEMRTRRIFLATLPIALPLWIAALIAMGVLVSFRKLAEPLVKFWNDPPQRRYRYYAHSRNED